MSRAGRAGRIAALVVVGTLAAVVAGCTPAGPKPTPPPLGALGALTLPTLAGWTGACRGVGLGGVVLTGDPSDPRVAWMMAGSTRSDVLFPPGFTARFTPRLEVLDGAGHALFWERTEEFAVLVESHLG